MKPQPNFRLAFHVTLCALFGSFLFIDNGIIGRLDGFNVILLTATVALTAVELIRHIRRKS